MLLEVTSKFKTHAETEAKDLIEKYRVEANQKGYVLKKAGYEKKDKKAKGEIIDTVYVISITQVFGSLWEEE